MLRYSKLTCAGALRAALLWSSHAHMHWYTRCYCNYATVLRCLNSCAVASILDATALEIHVQTWHCGMWSSCALAPQLDATVLEVHVCLQTYLMLRYLDYMHWWTWCYATWSACTLAHATLLEVHVRRYTWWYGTWSSVAVAGILVAPLLAGQKTSRECQDSLWQTNSLPWKITILIRIIIV